jgi:hypothetical protein
MSNAQIVAGGQPIPNRTDPGGIGTNAGANDGDVIAVGTPVVLNIPASAPQYSPSRADALARARVTGLVTRLSGTAAGDALRVQFQGIATLSEDEWQAVTAGGTGLIPGTVYYLSDAANVLTDTPPVTSGHFVTVIGWALTTTQLQLQIGTPIENP